MGITCSKKKTIQTPDVYFALKEGTWLEGLLTRRPEDLSQYSRLLLVLPPGHCSFCSADRRQPTNSVLFEQVERPPVVECTHALDKVSISYFCVSHMISSTQSTFTLGRFKKR